MKKSLCYIALLALFTTACSEAPKEETAVNTAQAQTEAAKSVPVGDTSQNSLDWAGSYEGVLPCASCEGMQTLITLQADNSFVQETVYLGKDEKILKLMGKVIWDELGQKITLEDGTQYLVGENQLIMLDTEGKRITGELAANYVLKKKGL
ncbi:MULTISPECIES: copper resistance protein NlpE [unclassified Shewanella]|uniref:copper resistance protein NlpE n=1 Tax=unclassified Shewanella TaxID=196818 RepID=UPI0021D9638F|nr:MULTISPECIES: copper resistance protein NlpE [unclassified Shewanella]MCU8044138.1 copper resistance protein NlpE [Shewanella sp. SM68]MCU8048220.1 copper resistance protein NlpE [Shewanella sp. SM65]MCU8073659.1 copper resistance protein NlpE [Shewanella sp. SM29]